ncbi:hypothetical protein WICMUC_001613 [Wickerhamomyces mucosus]|uniref:Uncharacterized protein n=1 Tax=Wickerhamomyces mucosus TaxID=1378264 RepID=A0A9P8TGU4_9ASCO|nr:hypothetical protein WICMUC_001613 [Wickerhamomyces mucosus]
MNFSFLDMSTLEEQAADRKNRLVELRKQRKQPSENSERISDELQTEKSNELRSSTEKNIDIKSRNFNFDNWSERKAADSESVPQFINDNNETVEALSLKLQQDILAQFEERAKIEKINIKDIIKPKKITWDLERDLKDDSDLLQEKTDNILRNVVKERIRNLANAHIKEEDN